MNKAMEKTGFQKSESEPENKLSKLDQAVEVVEAKKEKESKTEELDYRMLSFLREHIDIPELAGFDPAMELKEIRSEISKIPKKDRSIERGLMMEHFRKKLKLFRKNLSKAQVEMEDMLREDPDGGWEKHRKKLQDIISRNLIQSQSHFFEIALDKYTKAHKGIKETVEEYKDKWKADWEKELFRDLFGGYPKGKVEIEILPTTLYFRIYDLEDYVYAFIAESNEDKKIAGITARSTGGIKLHKQFLKLPQLNDQVLLENTALGTPEYSKEVKVHEEEHSIQDFYPTSVFVKNEKVFRKVFDLRGEADIHEFKEALKKYARNFVSIFEKHAKEEILASLKGGKYIPDIRRSLLEDDGMYDYVTRAYGEIFVKKVLIHFEGEKTEVWGKFMVRESDGTELSKEKLIRLTRDAIRSAWNHEYKHKVNEALDSVEKIMKMYSEEKNRMKVLRLLSQEPLIKWPRLARILS